ncbi:MAG TPA: hypothetical protein VMO47_12985 [Rhodothermales bacterium]|nr:hypothetical protein [Rhodothermales bacterium]
MSRLLRAVVPPFMFLVLAEPAAAQMFSYGGYDGPATQALSVTTYLIDFRYDGDGDPLRRLDWDGMAYGVTFERRNIAVSIVFGNSESTTGAFTDNLRMVDATLSVWGDVVRSRGSTASVGLPIVIHSGFRSVDGDLVSDLDESFSYTVLGIGTGATFEAEASRSILIQAHAWPAIAMAFRSFEGFAGSSTLIEGDLRVHFMNLFGRYGLSAAYGYRWQKWNTNETGLTANDDGELFDYKSNQHMLRLGLNW